MRDRSDSHRSLATEYRHGMVPSVASSMVYSPENAYTYVHSPAYSDVSPQGPPPAQEFGSPAYVPATVEQINSTESATSTSTVAATNASPLARASGNEAVIQKLIESMLDGYDGSPIDCDMERELNNNTVTTTTTANTSTVVNGH